MDLSKNPYSSQYRHDNAWSPSTVSVGRPQQKEEKLYFEHKGYTAEVRQGLMGGWNYFIRGPRGIEVPSTSVRSKEEGQRKIQEYFKTLG